MEPERSHNFQRTIVETSAHSDIEHQIILTTSMIAPDLDVAEYVIGDPLAHDNRALRGIQT